MTVRAFIKLDGDIDVYDDVCEELGICACLHIVLTEDGEAHFCEVLDYGMSIDFSVEFATAVVHVDDEFSPDLWEHKLHKAEEFFWAQAGYCANDDYHKWFAIIGGEEVSK